MLRLALKGVETPPLLLKLISGLCTGMSKWVRVGQKHSHRFVTFSGIHQGCVLAPALFCAATDHNMEHFSCSWGITVGGSHFTELDYADHVTLFVNEPAQLACVLHSMKEESTKLQLHVSLAKTKVQNLGAGYDAEEVITDWNKADVYTSG